MKLSEKMLAEIRSFHDMFKASNELYACAKAGTMSPTMLSALLAGIEYLTKSTIPCLEQAAAVARARGAEALARFYINKIPEEIGHDQWARNDRETIAKNFAVHPDIIVPEGIYEMVGCQYAAMARNPKLYLVHMLFAEYFTVIAVGDWVTLLKEKSHLGPELMSVLTKHAELDRDHVEDDLHQINKFVSSHYEYCQCMEHLYRTMGNYEQFCSDIAARYGGQRHRKAA